MSHTSAESVTKNEEKLEQLFTLWTVFRRSSNGNRIGADAVDHFDSLLIELAADDVIFRGAYDVSAMRENADIMVWLHGPTAEGLQRAIRGIRRSPLFSGSEIAWSAMGAHREAEFAKNHTPAFYRHVDPKGWLCVYPFVRSYEWYILPAEERGRMLKEHGMLGREFPGVLSNTVSSFALGDWEWILALEADTVVELVDLMRHLRGTDARLHVREEIPFYTGRRVDAAGIAEVLA